MDPLAPDVPQKVGFKQLVSNFKALSAKDKGLLSFGAVVAMFVALPLLVYTILTTRTNFINRAASGEISGEIGCVAGLQSASLLPSKQSGAAGSALPYTLSIVNTDSGNCAPEAYSLNYIIPGPGWGAGLPTGSISVITGQSASVGVTFISPSSASDGTYLVGMNVTGPQGSATASGAYIVSSSTSISTPKPTPTQFPTPTPVATSVPTPSPSAKVIPTPTGIITRHPPPAPTGATVPGGGKIIYQPSITTFILPLGIRGRPYFGTVYGQDLSQNVTMYMSFANLPAGLNNGGCVNTVGSPALVSCSILGTPKTYGFFRISARIIASDGHVGVRTILLPISPWGFFF